MCVCVYIHTYKFLLQSKRHKQRLRKKKREEKNLAALSAIQNMFADDKGWESEEEMLADMADFRRERLK